MNRTRAQTPDIDKLVLGDNPFIGVDHLSRERSREKLHRLNTKDVVEVIDTALANGAQGLSFSTHPIMYDALRQMRAASYKGEFGVYPLIPYAHEYIRVANERGLVGLTTHILSNLTWTGKAKTLIGGGLSLAMSDPLRVLRTYIDAELEIVMRSIPPRAILKSILLHEVITDLAIAFQATQLLHGYADHVLKKYRVKPGFVTRNFARFVSLSQESGLDLDQVVILTPFNKVGFQMNPSREACEQALGRVDKIHVIAMSILASGFLNFDEALSYLKGLPKIESYLVGVSTRDHAIQTFSRMRELASLRASPLLC